MIACCENNVGHGFLINVVMPVCMASYMTADYGHANHAFRVNVHS